MHYVNMAGLKTSRFIIGGNPFSGFSHQGVAKDREMVHYYTAARIKDTLRQAESLGINTMIARVDHHILRLFTEYRDEGGQLRWFAQLAEDIRGNLAEGANCAIQAGASACYIHGGLMDVLLSRGDINKILPALEIIKAAGLKSGVAGHNPAVFDYAEKHLEVDFYMCCYYNPVLRTTSPGYTGNLDEKYSEHDRHTMVGKIAALKKPAIHYKIMAAGRNDPEEAFAFAGKHMRGNDAACVGIYLKDNPRILHQNVMLTEKHLDVKNQRQSA